MPIYLSIDPKLVEAALEVSGEKTKRAAVTRALEEFVARRRQKRLLELMRKLEWDSGYALQGRALPRVTLFKRSRLSSGRPTHRS